MSDTLHVNMRQGVPYLNQAFPFRQAVTHQPAQP